MAVELVMVQVLFVRRFSTKYLQQEEKWRAGGGEEDTGTKVVVVVHSSPVPGTVHFFPKQWQIITNADELSLPSTWLGYFFNI